MESTQHVGKIVLDRNEIVETVDKQKLKKINGSLDANKSLLGLLVAGIADAKCQIAVCVPAPYLSQVQHLLMWHGYRSGCAGHFPGVRAGAFTGEVSAGMLRDFSTRYCLVGHSERRQYHGETDVAVAVKVQRALAAGITPIVCVGETLAEREAGKTEEVVKRQLGRRDSC